eukprot:8471809-Pyramimonas_sp.AAC.1
MTLLRRPPPRRSSAATPRMWPSMRRRACCARTPGNLAATTCVGGRPRSRSPRRPSPAASGTAQKAAPGSPPPS